MKKIFQRKSVRAYARNKNIGLVPSLPFGYYLDRNTGIVEIDSETAELNQVIKSLIVQHDAAYLTPKVQHGRRVTER